MRKLVHPNLVNLKDIFLEKSRLLLVMELMQVRTRKSHVVQNAMIFFFKTVIRLESFKSTKNSIRHSFHMAKYSGRSSYWCSTLHSHVRGPDSSSNQGNTSGSFTWMVFGFSFCEAYLKTERLNCSGHRLLARAWGGPQGHQIGQRAIRRGA